MRFLSEKRVRRAHLDRLNNAEYKGGKIPPPFLLTPYSNSARLGESLEGVLLMKKWGLYFLAILGACHILHAFVEVFIIMPVDSLESFLYCLADFLLEVFFF